MQTRPVWAEINLDNLAHNVGEIKKVINKDTQIMAVIKADGYGHGASEIGQTLLDAGADKFAVATLSEAIRLRSDFAEVPILVLGYTPNDMADLVLDHKMTQSLYSLDQAQHFNQVAKDKKQVVKVHLKIDTGMSRLGFLYDDASIQEVIACFKLDHLQVEGVYTHFACADEEDKSTTHLQVERYNKVIAAILAAGHDPGIKHVCNSAGIIDLPQYHFDMVRAGIMLYGLYPSHEVDHSHVKLKEAMSLKARVSHVKHLPQGQGVSYGHIYKTQANEKIATLPLGYADGFTRLLTGKTDVLLKGKRVPIVGKICMDQCMISPGDLEVVRDDVVTLFGSHEGAFKSIDEVAAAIGTINYEIVCMIDKRVPRHYYKNGDLCLIKDDVLRLAKEYEV